MKVTEHFDSTEFDCHDGTSYPKDWIDSRLFPLCTELEVVRKEAGNKCIHIDSGYRTSSYNKKLPGAARFSQHMEGRAADIVIGSLAPEIVHALVLKLYNEKKIQIGGLGSYPSFTHVDIRLTDRLVRWTGSRNSN